MFNETKIFKYSCPQTQKEVWEDPLRILRMMREKTNGQLSFLLEMMDGSIDKPLEPGGPPIPAHPNNVKQAAMAEEALIDAARMVFDLRPWNPEKKEGVLDQDVIDLINSWIRWMNQKKSSGN